MWLMWLGIGIGLPLFFLLLKLVVEVYEDHLFIQYWPLTSRKIDFSEIVQVTTRTYSPIKEYGGWGIRGLSSGKKMAYNVKGNKGVELTLRGGRKVMIGSQRANELALAITVGIESSRPNTTA